MGRKSTKNISEPVLGFRKKDAEYVKKEPEVGHKIIQVEDVDLIPVVSVAELEGELRRLLAQDIQDSLPGYPFPNSAGVDLYNRGVYEADGVWRKRVKGLLSFVRSKKGRGK